MQCIIEYILCNCNIDVGKNMFFTKSWVPNRMMFLDIRKTNIYYSYTVCLYKYVWFVLCILLQVDLGSEMGNGQSQISSLDIFNKIAIS